MRDQDLPELESLQQNGTNVGIRLGYLSGAPRVSTHPQAEATGARSHMLGMLGAFEELGWTVERFIVGDRVPQSWSGGGSQLALTKSLPRRLAADILRILLGLANARRAQAALRGRIDLVYERFGAFQALGSRFRRDGTPWILETNGPLFYEAKVERRSLVLSGVARRLEEAVYKECDVLVCISEELKRILVEACNVPEEKVVVVPNGVDVKFFDPGLHHPVRPFTDFTVGFVGNLYLWAGLDLLLEAIADLRTSGLPVNAVIVGDGMMTASLREKAHKLGIGEYIAFTGRVPREKVPSYILGTDIGYSGQVALQMGKMYHSPLKLYEYMAMARPVLASSFADAQRVVREGVTGFLFPPSDRQGLKQALCRAYAARADLGVMGKRARDEVVAHHSWTARVGNLLPAVRHILSSRKDRDLGDLRSGAVAPRAQRSNR